MYGVQSLLPACHSGGGSFSRSLFIIVASESSLTIVRSKSKTAKDGRGAIVSIRNFKLRQKKISLIAIDMIAKR